MIRTNSKIARANVRGYVMVNYDPCGYDGLPESNSDFPVIAAAILATFRQEYRYSIPRYPNEQAAFASWCAGLPSVLDTCYFYNRSAISDLGGILELTEAERNKYSEQDAENLLTLLIYRELCRGEQEHQKASA